MKKMSLETIMRQAGTFKIMKYLYEEKNKGNDKKPVTTIHKETKVNHNSLYRSLDLLREYDILEKEKITGFPPMIYYMLTKRGMKITDELVKANDILRQK